MSPAALSPAAPPSLRLCSRAWRELTRPRHSPVGFVLLAADTAAAEQGEEEDEQQCQEGSCPDHPHPLVGLCKT